jgi:hypothetical protein
VVTNNVAICKIIRQIIKDKYLHTTYNGCTAHGIDLVLEDIGEIDWVHKIVNEAKTIINFIANHHKSQTLFREFSNKEIDLALLRPRDTRFGTNFIILERLQKVKTLIQQMIVSLEWKIWMCSNEK